MAIPEKIITYMAYGMALMLFLLITYIIINYRESTKALKLYSEHIKVTMNLEEVQNFIKTYRKPKIEVGEDRSGRIVIVRWFIKQFDKEKPSVTIHVDKKSKKPLKIEVK